MNKIKQYRNKYGLTQEKLAKKANISRSALSMYEINKAQPDVQTLGLLADILKTTIDNLAGRTNEPLYKPNRIDVLGSIQAGIPIDMVEDIVDWEDIPEEWLNGDKEFFGLKVKGKSMEPVLLENDTVIVEKTCDCENGQVCVVTINGEDATLKKVIKNENGIILQPYNKEFEPMFFNNKQIEEIPIKILGIVKEFRRKL